MLTLTLDQHEIEKALQEYISNQAVGVDISRSDVNIKLKAGRGGNGHTAVIEIATAPPTISENDAVSPDADTQEEQAIATPLFDTDD